MEKIVVSYVIRKVYSVGNDETGRGDVEDDVDGNDDDGVVIGEEVDNNDVDGCGSSTATVQSKNLPISSPKKAIAMAIAM